MSTSTAMLALALSPKKDIRPCQNEEEQARELHQLGLKKFKEVLKKINCPERSPFFKIFNTLQQKIEYFSKLANSPKLQFELLCQLIKVDKSVFREFKEGANAKKLELIKSFNQSLAEHIQGLINDDELKKHKKNLSLALSKKI